MTEQQERSFPYYRSPSTIRTEEFSHRMRGLDEAEVREFLDLLADQVQAGDLERNEMRTENERLRE
jgi:DivIVA domain-containing protein